MRHFLATLAISTLPIRVRPAALAAALIAITGRAER
jgi:hypothetical protein